MRGACVVLIAFAEWCVCMGMRVPIAYEQAGVGGAYEQVGIGGERVRRTNRNANRLVVIKTCVSVLNYTDRQELVPVDEQRVVADIKRCVVDYCRNVVQDSAITRRDVLDVDGSKAEAESFPFSDQSVDSTENMIEWIKRVSAVDSNFTSVCVDSGSAAPTSAPTTCSHVEPTCRNCCQGVGACACNSGNIMDFSCNSDHTCMYNSGTIQHSCNAYGYDTGTSCNRNSGNITLGSCIDSLDSCNDNSELLNNNACSSSTRACNANEGEIRLACLGSSDSCNDNSESLKETACSSSTNACNGA